MKKELNEKNHTTQHPPQPRDGTLNRRLPVQEANWFGTAHEPQEEFCELDSNEAIRKHSDDRRGPATGQMSEGQPTFGKR